jgi:tetratricopeptide (TPR) repeat protein
MMSDKLFILLIILVLTISMGCSSRSDKIPITTHSEIALKSFLEGRELVENFRNLQAQEILDKAIEADSGFAMAYFYRSLTTNSATRFFEYVNTAVELSENVSDGERLIIQAFEAGVNSDPSQQKRLLKSLVELYPNDERSHMFLATFYFGQQEYIKAIDYFKKSIDINPTYSAPYNMLGYSNWRINNFEEAEEAFEKYIELTPDDPNPYDSYGELKMKLGKYGLSIESYYKALEIDPDFVASHLGIAANLNFLGKHTDARDQLKEFYNLADKYGLKRQALLGMAVSFADEGNIELAIKALTDRHKLAEKENDIGNMAADFYLIGLAYTEIDELDKAEEYFQGYYDMILNGEFSDEIKATAGRNKLYTEVRIDVSRNELESAKEKFNEFHDRVRDIDNPTEIRNMHELAGIIAMAENNFELAVLELRRSSLENPYNFYRIAQAYEGMGNLAQARDMYQKAAYANIVNNLNYSFIRQKALQKLKSLGVS